MSDTPGQPSQSGGNAGMLADASTLASTGLLAAVLFATGAGIINFLGDPGSAGFRGRLLQLTNTVDVGDVALLGIAVALLLLTPDPPGGFSRRLLLQVDALLGVVITLYGIVRSLVVLTEPNVGVTFRAAGFISTVGVALAAATVAFYAAKESTNKAPGN